jgi:hypothetical protein
VEGINSTMVILHCDFIFFKPFQQIDLDRTEPTVRATIQQKKMQDIRISAELKSGLEFGLLDEWR